ncbi:hypothetical protein [Bowmanella denitrificans]|uniref:hypothetical protein n=1 Tax=Bowmanella denitrificans TaxID=366582 RepID=UPI000C9D10D9|nr:hypothetical protein [Bowmanella denitrificans]
MLKREGRTTKVLHKNYLGFDFVKAGHFELGEKSHTHKNGEWQKPTVFKPTNRNFLKAGTSAYLVILGSNYQQQNILYVGEYTGSLHNRWFQRHSQGEELVVWHSDNLADNINRVLMCELQGDKAETSVPRKPISDKDKKIISKIQTEMLHQLQDGEAPEISLWLTLDPYVETRTVGRLNISRAIEQHFLSNTNLLLPLNSKGRQTTNDAEDVADITNRQS